MSDLNLIRRNTKTLDSAAPRPGGVVHAASQQSSHLSRVAAAAAEANGASASHLSTVDLGKGVETHLSYASQQRAIQRKNAAASGGGGGDNFMRKFY